MSDRKIGSSFQSSTPTEAATQRWRGGKHQGPRQQCRHAWNRSLEGGSERLRPPSPAGRKAGQRQGEKPDAEARSGILIRARRWRHRDERLSGDRSGTDPRRRPQGRSGGGETQARQAPPKQRVGGPDRTVRQCRTGRAESPEPSGPARPGAWMERKPGPHRLGAQTWKRETERGDAEGQKRESARGKKRRTPKLR